MSLSRPPDAALDALGSFADLVRTARDVVTLRCSAATVPARIRALRPGVVQFCQEVHGRRHHGPAVRHAVGVAMERALPRGVTDADVAVWALAARRLVDEIYLLGEHRNGGAA